MAPSSYAYALARMAERAPLLKRLPVVRLLMLGEVVLLARDHIERLTPAERHRLVVLMRDARGRPSRLSTRHRDELQALIDKADPHLFAAHAVDKLSPVPVPNGVRPKGLRSPTKDAKKHP
jgi:hypothetical protein